MNDNNQIPYNMVESISNISLRSKARAYQAIVSLGREDGNFTSFQEAINYVWNTPQKTGVVLVMPGTYVQTADIAIYSGIKLMGFDPALTIIDFDGDRNIICYGDDTADNSGNDIIFQGLQFKDSTDTAGAVNCNSCTRVDFIHCVFTNNTLDIGETSATNVSIYQSNINGATTSAIAKDSGWIPVLDTLTYASATTFTIPGDQTSVFQKGTRIKLTNSGTKYFVVTGSSYSSSTTVTITGGSDYSLANAAITNPYYSYQVSPQGYPTWFDYVPTYGATGSMTYTSVSTIHAKFHVYGKSCFYSIYSSGTTGGTASYGLTVSSPINPAVNAERGGCCVRDGSFMSGYWTTNTSSNTLEFQKYDTSNYALGASRTVLSTGFYEI